MINAYERVHTRSREMVAAVHSGRQAKREYRHMAYENRPDERMTIDPETGHCLMKKKSGGLEYNDCFVLKAFGEIIPFQCKMEFTDYVNEDTGLQDIIWHVVGFVGFIAHESTGKFKVRNVKYNLTIKDPSNNIEIINEVRASLKVFKSNYGNTKHVVSSILFEERDCCSTEKGTH
ncbi:hypothetical protein [Notoacmeibacter sp. MSK16QG-6]|uniref:hypothetical protein n=1 Tax=Notoacmeibacter sp. MSK16QG-6 TaxID=2957982 RepID=UPI00209EC169|nr:hypothetical protein [Notoacmeibacter sp. MSK16QG-6]MCP1201135.1 hypothetical protein [Notoacmeibacter sp. MSK16QG-6]